MRAQELEHEWKHCGLVSSRQDMTPRQRQRTPHLVYIFSKAHTPLTYWIFPPSAKATSSIWWPKKKKRLGSQKTFVVAPQQIKANLIKPVSENDLCCNTETNWKTEWNSQEMHNRSLRPSIRWSIFIFFCVSFTLHKHIKATEGYIIYINFGIL